MTPSEEKKLIRKNLSAKRLALKSSEVKENSAKILNTLSLHVDWNHATSLHTYVSVKENNEIDTGNLIAYLKQNYPDIKIETAPQKPAADAPEGMSHDLVIVPVLGFDRRGFRLGYGGGYYDKLLARNRFKQIIGLAYSFSEVSKIPDEPHDRRLQIVITEKEVIKAV